MSYSKDVVHAFRILPVTLFFTFCLWMIVMWGGGVLYYGIHEAATGWFVWAIMHFLKVAPAYWIAFALLYPLFMRLPRMRSTRRNAIKASVGLGLGIPMLFNLAMVMMAYWTGGASPHDRSIRDAVLAIFTDEVFVAAGVVFTFPLLYFGRVYYERMTEEYKEEPSHLVRHDGSKPD
ncbi:MAG: hypothetical protein R3301_10085 [Saprospiraceae bacterium]|nr:hypothetical protein [Saprospiraceae bacterium]